MSHGEVAAIFRRPRQEVLLVRHGESYGNVGRGSEGQPGSAAAVLGGPARRGFDCGLTRLGGRQAWEAGRGRVADFVARAAGQGEREEAPQSSPSESRGRGMRRDEGGVGDEDGLGVEGGVLVVVSPLTRALETAHLMLEGLEAGDADADAESGAGSGAGRCSGTRHVRVAVHPLAAEHVLTPGDVGRPRGELRAEFCGDGADEAPARDGGRRRRVHGLLREALEAEWGCERWWHRPDANDCARRVLGAKESRKTELGRRIRGLLAWIRKQRETRVVLVGHSTWFLAAFPGLKHGNRRLHNGECVRVPLR